jgi:phosphatidate cytidylyltransferase
MAAIGLICVGLGRLAVIAGVTLLSIFAFREFAQVSGLTSDRWMSGAVYVGIVTVGIASLVSSTVVGFSPFAVALFVAVGLIVLVPIVRNRVQAELYKIALSCFAFLLIGWMFGNLGLLANTSSPYGFLCYLIFATELTDISAFTFGRLFGRHPLRSAISPRKTVEGALGALVVAMILPWVLRFSFPFFSATQLILTGLIVGVGGLLGDLTISLIKRDLGTKDMSTIIPGHGGILDRIDSLIYVAPLFVYMSSYSTGVR